MSLLILFTHTHTEAIFQVGWPINEPRAFFSDLATWHSAFFVRIAIRTSLNDGLNNNKTYIAKPVAEEFSSACDFWLEDCFATVDQIQYQSVRNNNTSEAEWIDDSRVFEPNVINDIYCNRNGHFMAFINVGCILGFTYLMYTDTDAYVALSRRFLSRLHLWTCHIYHERVSAQCTDAHTGKKYFAFLEVVQCSNNNDNSTQQQNQ